MFLLFSLVQILFLALLMTTVYSAQNPNRFYLHQALQKSFSHRFSEIKLVKHFYPWAHHTLVPNLYGEYRGKNMDLGDSLVNSGMLLVSQTPFPWCCGTWTEVSCLLMEPPPSMGHTLDPSLSLPAHLKESNTHKKKKRILLFVWGLHLRAQGSFVLVHSSRTI